MSETEKLTPRKFEPLPLSAIKPTGWLLNQLQIQADGLSGHLDEFWPSVSESRWIGGAGEGWERGPYWLDGIIPLAILSDDAKLKTKAEKWVDAILDSQDEDGWLGPKNDPHEGTGEVTLDVWPLFIVFKALIQWEEATDDTRIIPALARAAARIENLLSEKPLRSWAKMRWADFVLSLHWLYEKTGNDALLRTAALASSQGFDWRRHFNEFRFTQRTDSNYLATLSDEDCLPLHGVNNAMGVKSGAIWARQSGDAFDARSSLAAVETLDAFHGQATGMFSGDEHLAGRSPVQGTETCTVTEYLFSLEQMLALTGEASLGDRLESIAFNALPAALDKLMRGRQYDQQPNQVLCSIARRDWVSNDARSNLFSLEGHFGCCTANFHQGWPKFTSHLWMATPENDGLAASAYAPCVVDFDGVEISETTDYPFDGTVTFTVNSAKSDAFSLCLRVPAWADGASVSVNGKVSEGVAPGAFFRLTRIWKSGDVVVLTLPMTLRGERRFQNSLAIKRGPLVFAIAVGMEWRQIGGELPYADWAVSPTTPWNYAIDASDLANAVVETSHISSVPFDDAAPPVRVRIHARRVSSWIIDNDSAAPPPTDFDADGPDETVTLVPYGCAPLRVCEFPAL